MKENWTKEELEAAVHAYVIMLNKEANGESFIKKSFYQELAQQFGRTEKAFEYRMQNISYVYSLMGRRWVAGLKPAKNVGARVAGELEDLINEIEGQALPKVAEFQSTVNTLKKNKNGVSPKGNIKPSKNNVETTQYKRDPKVVAWVINEANGICENCDNDAPFLKDDSSPFLEVHHLRRLADGGTDTTSNAVAVCPNCHRELHFGINKTILISTLYSKVKRLIVE